MCTVSRGETCARSDLRHREPDTNGVPRVQEVVIGSQTAGEMQKCVMPGPADGEPSAFRTDSTRREGINWPRGWGGVVFSGGCSGVVFRVCRASAFVFFLGGLASP